MYYDPNMYRYPHPYNPVAPMYPNVSPPVYWTSPHETVHANQFDYVHSSNDKRNILHDYGKKPFVVNINEATKQNKYYRKAIWTGNHLQVTLMSINVGEDIGLEVHPFVDQFLRVEDGQGIVRMGPRKDHLDFEERVTDDYAIMVPAGTWHNVINTGNKPLKLYSIYAPPNHPFGTVHKTKEAAMAAEEHHG
ncbi:cupin domain-containing protein [Neobacillus niacini]|uniref:cupin domain-containing protein n=1 Tax=Neobacillus niacini TaxID=86668 RepID=UPI003003117D